VQPRTPVRDSVAPGGVFPLPGRTDPRTIAVDLDDTLNDFTETLKTSPFPYEAAWGLPEATFDRYRDAVRSGAPDEDTLLSTEFSYFRHRIHAQCYQRAQARPDGVAFMRGLRADGWRIVICTHRDLRRVNAGTRAWLAEQGIPFDHLFMALNKIVFCRAWGIAHLVDDDPFNIAHGPDYGVRVYYPIMAKHTQPPAPGARGFHTFEEIWPWIRA
jgi:hypothetical protein